MKSSMFVVSGSIVTPNKEPAPNSSRTIPRMVSATVKPAPIPRPSQKLAAAPFLQAKASARPNIIQSTVCIFPTICLLPENMPAYTSAIL